MAGGRAADLESQRLDFKEDTRRSHSDLAKTVLDAALCFANSLGGSVVVGVDDKGAGPEAITGTALDADFIRHRIHELSRPPLLVETEEITIGGQRILAIHVPESISIHSDTQGRAPRRVGTVCRAMLPDEQRALNEERRGLDWSSAPTERPRADIETVAVEAARSLLRRLPDERRRLADLSDGDLLSALGVVSATGELLHAGDVLFCSADQPRALYLYKPTAGGEPTNVERLHGPLVTDFERIMELVAARRELTPLTLATGQQLHLEDFPQLAVREAVVNALLHRDFHQDGPVTIEHSPTTFVVASPGGLVAGVTTDNILTTPSKPRNRKLAQAVRTLGLAEEVGRGVDRMYREMIKSGHQIPQIIDEPAQVQVVLNGKAPNVYIARYVNSLPTHEQDDTDAMLILFHLCSTKHIQAPTLAPLLQRTTEQTEAILRRLAADDVGMIEPTRETHRAAHPRYRLRSDAVRRLGTAIGYSTPTIDDLDRKVIAHVREYGRITNQTLQNVFDINMRTASATLASLVDREVLVKTSEQQRGPKVEYGPGPKFPTRHIRRKKGEKSQESPEFSTGKGNDTGRLDLWSDGPSRPGK